MHAWPENTCPSISGSGRERLQILTLLSVYFLVMPQNTCTFTEFCAVWVIGLFLCTYFVVRQIRTLHALCVKTFLQWRSPSNHPPPSPKILAPRLNSAPMVGLVSMTESILSALAKSVLLGPGKKILVFGRLYSIHSSIYWLQARITISGP